VLGADQRRVGDGFMASMSAFDDLDWTRSEAGVPMLRNALASFECTFHAAHDGGDHTIVVGRVIRAHRRDGAPLVFHGGGYGTFAGNPTSG
jgi:flavin reductase (DIM6/NTAB) family NADH-FMN oxidoreductase RutF